MQCDTSSPFHRLGAILPETAARAGDNGDICSDEPEKKRLR